MTDLKELKIDKGVAIPAARYGVRVGDTARLLSRMEVGDSVLVPDLNQNRVLTRFRYAAKKQGVDIVSRLEEKGTRVWRLS